MADKAAERDIERMTTVYENMKPAEAAKIFERMDVSFAAGLLARVRPEIAAQVLAAMNADSAYAVTLTIASRNHAVPTEFLIPRRVRPKPSGDTAPAASRVRE